MMPRVSARLPEALLYVLTVFAPLAFGSVEPWSRAGVEVLAFALALSVFLRGRRASTPVAAAYWLFPAAFALLGVVQTLAPAAADGPRPPYPFTVDPSATSSAVLLWAAFAAVLWSVPRIIVTHEAARRFTRVLLGLGVFIALQGLLQSATGGGRLYWLRDAPGTENFGPFYNRDHAADFLLMAMSVGAGVFHSRVRRWTPAEGTSLALLRDGAPAAAALATVFAGFAACSSRGAFLALPLAAAALVLSGAGFAPDARRRRATAAAALAAAVLLVAAVFRYVGASADAGAMVERSVSGRLSIYGDAVRWFREAPFFGTGLGSFRTVYPSYQDAELRAMVAHAHCDWLETVLEGGLAALLAALAAAFVAARAGVRAWRSARSGEMRSLIGGALGAVLAFGIHAIFDFPFQIPGDAVVAAVLVGFLLSAPAWADKSAVREPSHEPSALPSLAAAACALLLAGAAAGPAATAWSAEAPAALPEHAVALRRAFARDPDPAYLKELSALLSGAGERNGDARAVRLGLEAAVEAVELRPFDSAALSRVARCLAWLRRDGDAAGRAADAESVAFPEIRRDNEAEREFEANRLHMKAARAFSGADAGSGTR